MLRLYMLVNHTLKLINKQIDLKSLALTPESTVRCFAHICRYPGGEENSGPQGEELLL